MSLSVCRDYILVSVFTTIGIYSAVLIIICLTYSIKRKKKRKQRDKGSRHGSNPIEGRRNKVYQQETDQNKENHDVDMRRDRKRQDSGFVASSNESIIPFPEIYDTSPRRSPSMPNLSTRSTEKQNVDENVFDSAVHLNHPIQSLERAQRKISIATQWNEATLKIEKSTSTNSLVTTAQDIGITSSRRVENVVIEKKSFNCTGLDFGIAGIYIKDVDAKDITFKTGSLSPGDEVLSINDFPLVGMSDMEAFSFFAKSGPDVHLKILKGGCLSKVETSSYDGDKLTTAGISTTSENVQYSTVTRNKLSYNDGLPRVIFDANNLSIDATNTTDDLPQKYCCHHQFPNQSINFNDVSTRDYETRTNEATSMVNQMGFSATSFTHDFATNLPSSSSTLHTQTSSCESSKLSRNTSFDRERLIRSTQNENTRHSRNPSVENNSLHSHHSSEDATTPPTYNLTRAQSEEALKNLVYANGVFQRSTSSGDSQLPVFTVESFKRTSNESLLCDREKQLYYQELLRTMNSNDGIIPATSLSLTTDTLGSQVTQALLSDSIMLQRGYNNDYIVPISSNHQSPRHAFPNKSHVRSREPSPSRRMPTQISPQPAINPRTQNTNLTPLPISAANLARSDSFSSATDSKGTQSSPVSTMSTVPFVVSVNYDTSRKPPPEYSAAVTPPEKLETLLFTNENVEIDADVMAYMTKKYREPRFCNGHWKDPPPYSSTHTTIQGNSDVVPVTLRTNGNSDHKIRSRPHSMTETVSDRDVNNVHLQEKRKFPKRTYSLPAVKHLEMRPRSAKVFLKSGSEDTVKQNDMAHKVSQKRLRQKQRLDSINRRKSIDSGTLRKLAEEIQVNPSLGGEYPIIAQLLGESQYSATERRAQSLYRHKSTETLAKSQVISSDKLQSEF